MRISVDKEYTMGCQMARVKEDIKTFKATWGERAIVEAIRSQSNYWGCMNADIVKMEVKAFPAGSYYGDVTHFAFDILLDDGYTTVTRIKCYTDIDLTMPNECVARIREYK